ncbi:transposase [Natronoglycomyces albus]|uniref:Transposase n=1 Tax=Natronoglycomyces albus TaxID=2811108 RepID=A0A895XLB7_9ACTN|nr:transposase [Natronoglycomyces albus]QSB06501.1 transposase [Natronoglycomyces albus]
MYYTVIASTVTVASCIEFLKWVVSQADQKVHLILDGHSVHPSKAILEWVAARPGHIQLYFLPSNTPHLNSDELVNADLKRAWATGP